MVSIHAYYLIRLSCIILTIDSQTMFRCLEEPTIVLTMSINVILCLCIESSEVDSEDCC